MTILVTGGAGFLGSHLIDILLKKDEQVICLDNYCTGNIINVEKHKDNKNFKLINTDISKKININEKVDEIYNLACPASPVHYQADSIFTSVTCFNGTLNLLELAEKNSAKLFHASTSEIYGDPLVHPQKESYWGNVNTIGPRSCYDEGKRIAETLCNDFSKFRNVDVRMVRIFNTYGPRMNVKDGRVVSNFINQALRNENITIYGDGTQTRSFCYFSDLIDGFVKLMGLDKQPIDTDGEIVPINLGNPTEFTMLELAELVLKLTNSSSKIIYRDLPKNDPLQRKPDIKKATNLLNWKPLVALESGVSQTIDYYKKYL